MDQHGPLRLLALESATSRLSVALFEEGGRLIERGAADPGHHAERILPLIDQVLAEAGTGIAEVTAFAVSIGPGSFTSLRVGLATAKGLALVSSRPIVAVPTLEAIAFGALAAGDSRPIAAVLDARRGEMYAAVFEPGPGGLRRRLADGLFSCEELAGRLPPHCRLVGEGAHAFGPALRERAGPGVALPEPDAPPASAASVAWLGLARLRRGEIAAGDLTPRYVRRAEAEATRTSASAEDPA